jgi:hypothetical protein
MAIFVEWGNSFRCRPHRIATVSLGDHSPVLNSRRSLARAMLGTENSQDTSQPLGSSRCPDILRFKQFVCVGLTIDDKAITGHFATLTRYEETTIYVGTCRKSTKLCIVRNYALVRYAIFRSITTSSTIKNILSLTASTLRLSILQSFAVEVR